METKTSDLYCASYIFTEGGILKDVQIISRGDQPCVEFLFIGDDVTQLEKTYQSGKAKTDLKSFKSSMHHIKDVMFQALRRHELAKLQQNQGRTKLNLL